VFAFFSNISGLSVALVEMSNPPSENLRQKKGTSIPPYIGKGLILEAVTLVAPVRSSVTRSDQHVEHVQSGIDNAPGQARNYDSQLDVEVAGL
jgi:hypothetical protein